MDDVLLFIAVLIFSLATKLSYVGHCARASRKESMRKKSDSFIEQAAQLVCHVVGDFEHAEIGLIADFGDFQVYGFTGQIDLVSGCGYVGDIGRDVLGLFRGCVESGQG